MRENEDLPFELKKGVAKKLQKSGALKRIERKIKIGMMVAQEELSENDGVTHLNRKPFANEGAEELKALQSVLAFLSDNHMSYTLATLMEETSTRLNRSQALEIRQLLSLPLEVEDDSLSDSESL